MAPQNHREIYYDVLAIFSIISSVASIAMIILIHKMGYMNGHILLILVMSWAQFIYDIGFYPSSIDHINSELSNAAFILIFIGGIGVAIFSNIILVIALYVIIFKKSFDVNRYFRWYSIIA